MWWIWADTMSRHSGPDLCIYIWGIKMDPTDRQSDVFSSAATADTTRGARTCNLRAIKQHLCSGLWLQTVFNDDSAGKHQDTFWWCLGCHHILLCLLCFSFNCQSRFYMRAVGKPPPGTREAPLAASGVFLDVVELRWTVPTCKMIPHGVDSVFVSLQWRRYGISWIRDSWQFTTRATVTWKQRNHRSESWCLFHSIVKKWH